MRSRAKRGQSGPGFRADYPKHKVRRLNGEIVRRALPPVPIRRGSMRGAVKKALHHATCHRVNEERALEQQRVMAGGRRRLEEDEARKLFRALDQPHGIVAALQKVVKGEGAHP